MDDFMEFERDELVQTFRAETEEQLQAIEEALVRLEAAPSDVEALAEIFRFAHTLKGNCGVLDLKAPEQLAHVLESLLERLRDGALGATPPLVALLLRAVDALRTIVSESLAGQATLGEEHL